LTLESRRCIYVCGTAIISATEPFESPALGRGSTKRGGRRLRLTTDER